MAVKIDTDIILKIHAGSYGFFVHVLIVFVCVEKLQCLNESVPLMKELGMEKTRKSSVFLRYIVNYMFIKSMLQSKGKQIWIIMQYKI